MSCYVLCSNPRRLYKTPFVRAQIRVGPMTWHLPGNGYMQDTKNRFLVEIGLPGPFSN